MIRESLQHALRSSRRALGWALVLAAVVYALSGLYSVENNEVAVHQRFGKVIDPRVPAGIHYALPWPIDRVEKVAVQKVHRLVIDDFQPGDRPGTASSLFRNLTGLDSFCVTGDNNVVNIGCAIQYLVTDPAAYLFRPMAPETLLRAVACNSMIHALSTMEVDRALTLSSQQIKDYIQLEMNRTLEELGTGLSVIAVDLQPVRPPRPVQSYFDDVVNAKIDRSKAVAQAQADQNERLAQARVRAIQMVREAESYRATQVAGATGRAERFAQQLSAYREAPDLTRRRLYLDAMRTVLAKVRSKVVSHADEAGPAAHLRLFAPK